MNKINLNDTFSRLEEARDRLRRLKMKRRELIMKRLIKMPMTMDEEHNIETIDVDIEQQEYFVEWIEESEDDWD